MSYSILSNPETNSSRPSGEYLPEHYARVHELTEGFREAMHSLKDVISKESTINRQDEIVPAITSLATAQSVESVVDPVVARVDSMTDEEREQEARELLAQVWAGMEPVDEIHLTSQPVNLDNGFLQQMEQEV